MSTVALRLVEFEFTKFRLNLFRVSKKFSAF